MRRKSKYVAGQGKSADRVRSHRALSARTRREQVTLPLIGTEQAPDHGSALSDIDFIRLICEGVSKGALTPSLKRPVFLRKLLKCFLFMTERFDLEHPAQQFIPFNALHWLTIAGEVVSISSNLYLSMRSTRFTPDPSRLLLILKRVGLARSFQ
jgi:hypothetical protein